MFRHTLLIFLLISSKLKLVLFQIFAENHFLFASAASVTRHFNQPDWDRPVPGQWVRYHKWTCSCLIYLCWHINPCLAEFNLENLKSYLHYLQFLNTYMEQVVEILLGGRPGPVYPVWSISWLLMAWRCKEPKHQQPWYLFILDWIF